MTILKKTIQLASSLFLFLVIGCHHDPYLEDDEGIADQDSGAHADNLSLPYAQGTKVRVTVNANGADGLAAWKLQSDNPAVLTVDKLALGDGTPTLIADCTAVGAGDAMLHLTDGSGAELRTTKVSVAVPDRLRVLAHGPLRLAEQTNDALLKAEVFEARILSGSQGMFALVYQKGEQRLYGHGIIQSDPLAGVTVTNQTTSGAPVNEWLLIKPQSMGSSNLVLRRGSSVLVTLQVVSVPDSSVIGITLMTQQVASPKNDQTLWVFVQARDAANRAVQGVLGSWTLSGGAQAKGGGDAQNPLGDLYRFNYADGATKELAATHGALQAVTMVSAAKGSIYDTTYLGCSMGSHSARTAPLAPLILILMLGVTLLRSRRRPLGAVPHA